MKAVTALLLSCFVTLALAIAFQVHTPVATAAGAGVGIRDFGFDPATTTVTPGTEVTWTNRGGVSHTVASDTGLFDSGILSPNSDFSFTFSEAGSFAYHCNIHPSMHGTITVQAASPSPSGQGPSLSGPGDGERVASFGPMLSWSNGAGATQYQLQVVPFN